MHLPSKRHARGLNQPAPPRLAGERAVRLLFFEEIPMSLKHALAASVLVLTVGVALGTSRAEDKTDCALTYTRSACPGQEAESFKKCDGKQTCTKYVPADSEQTCRAAAVAACSNDRLTVTQSKAIAATWKGTALKSKSGAGDMCLDYAKRDAEFNKCGK
jgi:hypothetical protein